MACQRPLAGGCRRRTMKIGWIAYHQVRPAARFLFRIPLESAGMNIYAYAERTLLYILACLLRTNRFNLHGIHPEAWIPLGHHKGNQPGSASGIKGPRSIIHTSPGSQQDTIGAHLHSTSILADLKLLETKP